MSESNSESDSASSYATRPNKSEIKRQIKVLNQLGKELVDMPDGMLKKIPLSDSMQLAVADAKRFSRGALQRQLRRIASLMQHEDIESIRLEIARQKAPGKQQTAEFHQIEQWRDRLIAGDDRLLTGLIDQYPVIDRQRIRQLVRNVISEQKRAKPPKSSRLLFKYLSQIKSQTLELTDSVDESEQPSKN